MFLAPLALTGRFFSTIPPGKPEERGSEKTNPANTWIVDFLLLELQEHKFLLFKPLRLWYLIIAGLEN